MSETRTMAKDAQAAAKGKAGAGDSAAAEGGTKKGRKKLLVVAGVLLAAAGGGGYVVLGPSADAEAVEEVPEVELGEVVSVDPISINLADGHYLKLGLGLQTIEAVEYEPDGSLALDAAISLYSGRSMEEIGDPTQREALKEELRVTLEDKYHHEVVDVYFTEYVMQ